MALPAFLRGWFGPTALWKTCRWIYDVLPHPIGRLLTVSVGGCAAHIGKLFG